jgi:hypothetical protein
MYSFDDLTKESTGLLWLINRTCFHPRGFALALHRDEGNVVGWSLEGDGSECWNFSEDTDDECFARVEAFLDSLRAGFASD